MKLVCQFFLWHNSSIPPFLPSSLPLFFSLSLFLCQVMQKCDAVLASGQNVESFAIPALQPLVVYLFMTSSGKPSGELLTQREVHQSVFLFSVMVETALTYMCTRDLIGQALHCSCMRVLWPLSLKFLMVLSSTWFLQVLVIVFKSSHIGFEDKHKFFIPRQNCFYHSVHVKSKMAKFCQNIQFSIITEFLPILVISS